MMRDKPGKPPSTLLGMQGAVRGASPAQNSMDAKQNFGRGHGHSFFSEQALMGHAFSGTQLGQVDNVTRNAHSTLSRFRFAAGGKVEKPAGPSLKERRDIRAIIERGKADAVSTLRESRDALLNTQADQQSEPDFTLSLDKLRDRLATPPVAMAEGGQVEVPEEVQQEQQPQSGDPGMLYEEYSELLEQLANPDLDESLQTEIVERLADIESKLEAVGVDLGQ